MNGNRLLQCNLLLHGLGLLVTLGLVALAIVFVGMPMDQHQAQLQAQILDMESLLTKSADIEQKNRQLQSDVDQRSAQWNELLSRIPPEAQVSDFLSLLTDLAGQSGLKVESFTPGVTHVEKRFEAMDIDLQAAGNYASICTFLNGLSSMPRICNISKLDITALAQLPDQYTVALSLRILYKFDDSPADESSPPTN